MVGCGVECISWLDLLLSVHCMLPRFLLWAVRFCQPYSSWRSVQSFSPIGDIEHIYYRGLRENSSAKLQQMSLTPWLPDTLLLVPDSISRNKSIANTFFQGGSQIFSNESLATILLDHDKGRRCDACFWQNNHLKKCSGCGCYWYCDVQCVGWFFH